MTATVRRSLETVKLQNRCSTMQELGTAKTGCPWKDRQMAGAPQPAPRRVWRAAPSPQGKDYGCPVTTFTGSYVSPAKGRECRQLSQPPVGPCAH